MGLIALNRRGPTGGSAIASLAGVSADGPERERHDGGPMRCRRRSLEMGSRAL